MNLRKRNAFTLIELIATLVIMAIIALIATPLVMNVIRSARTSADKRSIDAYGRSIELAIAGYLLDNGLFPTNISQLTIEYSGNEVVCTTTQINQDSSVYLAGCTVAGRNVTDYTYGTNKDSIPTYVAYQVGNRVSYNGDNYYVIEDSDTKSDTVTLMKETALGEGYDSVGGSYAKGVEIQKYGDSIDFSTSQLRNTMNYKSHLPYDTNVKEIRGITVDELVNNFNYEVISGLTQMAYTPTEYTPNWLYDNDYCYWTISQYEDSEAVYIINKGGRLERSDHSRGTDGCFFRPVVELYKTATITKLES